MTFCIQTLYSHQLTTELSSITTFSILVSDYFFLVVFTYFLSNDVIFSMINAQPYYLKRTILKNIQHISTELFFVLDLQNNVGHILR